MWKKKKFHNIGKDGRVTGSRSKLRWLQEKIGIFFAEMSTIPLQTVSPSRRPLGAKNTWLPNENVSPRPKPATPAPVAEKQKEDEVDAKLAAAEDEVDAKLAAAEERLEMTERLCEAEARVRAEAIENSTLREMLVESEQRLAYLEATSSLEKGLESLEQCQVEKEIDAEACPEHSEIDEQDKQDDDEDENDENGACTEDEEDAFIATQRAKI